MGLKRTAAPPIIFQMAIYFAGKKKSGNIRARDFSPLHETRAVCFNDKTRCVVQRSTFNIVGSNSIPKILLINCFQACLFGF